MRSQKAGSKGEKNAREPREEQTSYQGVPVHGLSLLRSFNRDLPAVPSCRRPVHASSRPSAASSPFTSEGIGQYDNEEDASRQGKACVADEERPDGRGEHDDSDGGVEDAKPGAHNGHHRRLRVC